jgi:hypothetical protein
MFGFGFGFERNSSTDLYFFIIGAVFGSSVNLQYPIDSGNGLIISLFDFKYISLV